MLKPVQALLVVIMLVVCCAQSVLADGLGAVTLTGEVKAGAGRLLDESTDFGATPFTFKDGNLFWTLGIASAIGLTYAYDDHLRDRLRANRSTGLNRTADLGELVGNPYLHLGVAALIYGGGIAADSPKWKEAGEMLGEALILADTATLLVKEGTGRGRPSATSHKDNFRPFQFKDEYDSFPSMHTSSSFAMASVVARTSESLPVALLSYTAAALVSLSRIYQDKHWASDVLLSAAIGELSGRVVTTYHVSKTAKQRIVLLPSVSGSGAAMSLLWRF